MSKRKSMVQRGWTAEEDDALLRAWAAVVERRPKSQAKGLLLAYHALLGDAVAELERSSLALQNRRAMYVRMHDIICAFHAHTQPQQEQQTRRDDGENGTGATTATTATASAAPDHPEPKYSSASWFELPLSEQKRWFTSRDTKTYPFHKIQRDAFDRVAAILKLNNHGGKGDMSRLQATYTRPKVEKREEEGEAEQLEDGDNVDDGSDSDGVRDPLSTTHIRAMIDRLAKQKKETTSSPVRPAECKSDGGCIRPHRYIIRPEKEEDGDDDTTTTATTTTTMTNKADAAAVGGSNSGDGNSDGGSSTESDDEILSCWDENGDAIVPRSPMMVTTNVKSEAEFTIKTLQDDPFEQPSDQQFPHKQVGNVDPDLLELVSILETQARHLGEMFRQTKRARKEQSRRRRYIMKNIQLDREERCRVLEDLKRREQELQRERDEWQLERSNMKRELA